MATSFTHFRFLIALILSSALYIPAVNSQQIKKIYAFGDSYTDTGNTRSLSFSIVPFTKVSNFPYGITYFHVPTNRYSDGRLVIDFVAEALSLPFLQPYLYLVDNGNNGVNFAAGGSTAISNDFFVNNNIKIGYTPESLPVQINWFNDYLVKQGCGEPSPGCKTILEDALIWFGEIGVNDYAYASKSSISTEIIREAAIKSTVTSLQAVLRKGAKYVVVQGLPPSGCLSLTISMAMRLQSEADEFGCVKEENEKMKIHNEILQSKLQELRAQFPDATIAYLDYYNAYLTVLKNPLKYGFLEKFCACCGVGGPPFNVNVLDTCGMPYVPFCSDPSAHIVWDGVHLTESMYRVLADMFLSDPPLKNLLGI